MLKNTILIPYHTVVHRVKVACNLKEREKAKVNNKPLLKKGLIQRLD